MTPEPRSVEEALATLDEAAEGWPTPNSYTHALALLRSELTRLRGIEEAARKLAGQSFGSLNQRDFYALREALARPDRQEEGDG